MSFYSPFSNGIVGDPIGHPHSGASINPIGYGGFTHSDVSSVHGLGNIDSGAAVYTHGGNFYTGDIQGAGLYQGGAHGGIGGGHVQGGQWF